MVSSILLVDSRHKPTKDDITMANWIRHYHTNLIVVATKMDKLKKREIEPNLQRIWETLEMGEDDILVPFSTQLTEGWHFNRIISLFYSSVSSLSSSSL